MGPGLVKLSTKYMGVKLTRYGGGGGKLTRVNRLGLNLTEQVHGG